MIVCLAVANVSSSRKNSGFLASLVSGNKEPGLATHPAPGTTIAKPNWIAKYADM